MPKTLVTGAAGFIGGYLVSELLDRGHSVVGLDNFSKYGPMADPSAGRDGYEFVVGDAKDDDHMARLAADCDYLVAGAAMIGGISYFHRYAYDLLAENERIMASTVDAAIGAHRDGLLKRLLVISSSMVFESADRFPSTEGDQLTIPPPASSYGFQKLATEYFARAAFDQYGLPFTIVRPFNCVGVGERRAAGADLVRSGDIQLALSHVVPDLAMKTLKGQDPLRILGSGDQVRHYTYGADIARGIVDALESPDAEGEDFNISSAEGTTVLELAKLIWDTVHDGGREFRWVSDPPFRYDVQSRIPDTTKAREILGFVAETPLRQMIEIVVPWIADQIEAGRI